MSAGELEAVKRELISKGGSDADWEFLLSEGLQREDHQVYDGDAAGSGNPMNLAQRVFGGGRVLEYSCFDLKA